MNKRLRTIFQYTFFLGLGIFLVWWSIKDLNQEQRSQIRIAIQNARYYLIVPVFLVLILSHYVRAIRWRLLIRSIGYEPSRTNTFFAVMIGYLANQAFPRLGEVLKCSVLARYEDVPADKLIGTIILERLIDALTLVVIFAITLAIQPGLYSQLIDAFFTPSPAAETKKTPSWVIGLIVLGLIFFVLAIWMYRKKKKFSDLGKLISNILKRVWQGIGAIRHLQQRAMFIVLTILLWAMYLLGGYIGLLALKETDHHGIREAFTILSAGSIGMVITPGGIGAYPLLIQKSMMLYQVQSGFALAFGYLLWLVQTSVIIIGGLFSFVAIPYWNKRKLKKSIV